MQTKGQQVFVFAKTKQKEKIHKQNRLLIFHCGGRKEGDSVCLESVFAC